MLLMLMMAIEPNIICCSTGFLFTIKHLVIKRLPYIFNQFNPQQYIKSEKKSAAKRGHDYTPGFMVLNSARKAVYTQHNESCKNKKGDNYYVIVF
jgi:hypothetical protein